jgi:integrase
MKNPSSLKTQGRKAVLRKIKTKFGMLHQEETTKWRICGKNYEGEYKRERFEAADVETAMAYGKEILFPKEKSQVVSDDLTIEDALCYARKNKNWDPYTEEKDMMYCVYFMRWTIREGLHLWRELRREHIEKYKHELESERKAYDTIRLYLSPVRRTSSWVSSNWPREFDDFCRSMRLDKRKYQSKEYKDDDGNPYIDIHQVLGLIDFLLRQKKTNLAVGVALQGLVGLQLQEAYRLTWNKFDLQESTITIDGLVKNPYRKRKLPIPQMVTQLLEDLPVDSQADRIITGYKDFEGYAYALRKLIKKWNPDIGVKPKDLRNTIQTEGIDGDWNRTLLQRYVGHSPSSITEKHYFGDQGKKMVERYREKILPKIEERIRSWSCPQDSPLQKLHDDCTMGKFG